MTRVAAVVEGDVLLQAGQAGAKNQFHRPLHSVHAVDVADLNRSAAIGFLAERKIDGRDRDPVVRDGEVELDPQRRPRAAVGHARLLDGGVRVEHVGAVDLVHAAIEVAAEVGQDDDPEVLVLEVEGAPARRRAPVGQVLAQRVGIVEAPRLEDVEGRVDVGEALFVGREVEVVLPHAHRRGGHLSGRHRRDHGGGEGEDDERAKRAEVHRGSRKGVWRF